MLSDARRIANLLGISGVLPFAALAFAALLAGGDWKGRAVWALAAYGAGIVSFLGAVHWGFAIAQPQAENTNAALVLGVLPQLAAWVALLAPAKVALLLLAVEVLAVLALDRWSVGRALGPDWWMPLRVRLSAAAAVFLFVGGVAA